MSCDLEKDRLSGYLDGELDERERAEVERHIASCSECLRELGELKAAVTDLRGLPPLKAPATVGPAVARSIGPRRAAWQRRLQLSVAAAAAVLLAVSLYIIAAQGPAAPEHSLALREEARPGATEKAVEAPAAEALEKGPDAEEAKKQRERARGRNELENREPPPQPPAPPAAAAVPQASPAPADRAEGLEDEKRKAGDADEEAPGAKAFRGERERDGRAPAPGPAVLGIASPDRAAARATTEALLKKLGATQVAGADELGKAADVKLRYLTVELTDSELDSLKRELARAKLGVVSSTVDEEKERLAQARRDQLESGGRLGEEESKEGGARKTAPTLEEGAEPKKETAKEEPGASKDKIAEDRAKQGGGAGGAAPAPTPGAAETPKADEEQLRVRGLARREARKKVILFFLERVAAAEPAPAGKGDK